MLNKQDCVKNICVDKTSYKITKTLLDELYNNAKKAKQEPFLELLIKAENGEYYKLNCKVEKVRI